MRPALVKPCPTCGYHAPTRPCRHCGETARERSLAGPPPQGWRAVLAGARALPLGFWILLSTPRTKRWLVPPFMLACIVYGLAFTLAWRLFAGSFDELVTSEPWSSMIEAGTFLVSAIVFAFLFAWTFAFVYQAIAAPFLDVIQGRIEARWFGADPRATIVSEAEQGLTRTGKWFLFSKDQARSLLVSVETSIIALVIMLLFVWVLFIPVAGGPLFAPVAGFATSIALVDIPCSRRNWSFARRMRFVFANIGAVVALGVVTSLTFLVPIIGPIVGVTSAMIGGQWLLVRLDKSRL